MKNLPHLYKLNAFLGGFKAMAPRPPTLGLIFMGGFLKSIFFVQVCPFFIVAVAALLIAYSGRAYSLFA